MLAHRLVRWDMMASGRAGEGGRAEAAVHRLRGGGIDEGEHMPELPRPTAARLQRPSWRDARLVVGVVLVLLAMTGGAVVVAAADDTTPVYAAAGGLVPGQAVRQSDVRRVDVRLGSDGAAY